MLNTNPNTLICSYKPTSTTIKKSLPSCQPWKGGKWINLHLWPKLEGKFGHRCSLQCYTKVQDSKLHSYGYMCKPAIIYFVIPILWNINIECLQISIKRSRLAIYFQRKLFQLLRIYTKNCLFSFLNIARNWIVW